MNIIRNIWDRLKGANKFDIFTQKIIGSDAVYPEATTENFIDFYSSSSVVFSAISKIVNPTSRLNVYQYNKDNNLNEGKLKNLFSKPNSYQKQNEFLLAALTNWELFGEVFIAGEVPEDSTLKYPVRLDVLPSSRMKIITGTVFNPVAGYEFFPENGDDGIAYRPDEILHIKSFNPDYSFSGGHLRGQSKLKVLLKTVIGNGAAYDAFVRALQTQGAWGLLSILGEDGLVKQLTKEQASKLKKKFKRDKEKGELTIINDKSIWQQMGLTMVELDTIKALNHFKGDVYDVYNVPPQLFAGSNDRTYNNYKEAEAALWNNAIIPSVDNLLKSLSEWLAPKFGEDGNILQADYSVIAALQKNVGEMIGWMIQAKAFTKNEIREAAGYEVIDIPQMNQVMVSYGEVPIDAVDDIDGLGVMGI